MKKNISRFCCIVFAVFLCSIFTIHAADLVLGDWTSVSTQAQVTFAGDGNEIVGFKQMNHGFILQDENASCTFNAVFPVSGQIDLNGGDLFLQQDLILANSASLLENTHGNTARIYGNDHVVEFTEEMNELCSSFSFDNVHIYLNSDLVIKSPLFFRGACTINGRGNRIFVQDNGSINLEETGELLLTVGGIRLDKSDIFSFDSQSSKVILKDFNVELTSDVRVEDGQFEFDGDVNFAGPYTFTYDSLLTSVINQHATLRFNQDSTLRLGKKAAAAGQPIEFADSTGRMIFDNAGMQVTHDGLQLQKGGVIIYGKSVFNIQSSDVASGLKFGNGTAGNDVLVKIKNGSELEVATGAMVMNEYAQDKLIFDGDSGQLYMNGASKLRFDRPITIDGGTIRLSTNATIERDSDAYVIANGVRIHDMYQDFYLTGSIIDQDSVMLDQNDELVLRHGNLSKTITVSRDNNILHGDGALSGNIILLDENSTLSWSIDAKIDEYSMVLNNGILALERDLDFYQNLTGFAIGSDVILSGTLALDNHVMKISANDSVWTGSFYVTGNGSRMAFNAKVDLSGTWTIDGIHTIDGNGQTLEFGQLAEMYVTKDSRLTLRNMTIKNLSGTKLSALDDSAQIIFDNVLLVQDADYSFDTGRLIFRNQVDLIGGSGCSADSIFSFSYNSDQSSTIDENSTFHIMRGIRFELGNDDWQDTDQPVEFSGLTSVLHLDEGIIRVHDQGWKLLCGRMRVSNNSMLDVDTVYGVTLGDGTNMHDFILEIEGDAKLTVDGCHPEPVDPRGILFYNNYRSDGGIVFISEDATLRINETDGLTAVRSVLLEYGTLNFPSAENLATLGSAVIDQTRMRHVHDVPYSSHILKGRFQTGVGYLLVDNGYVVVTAGRTNEAIVFDSGFPLLGGVGIINSLLSLQDEDTVLNMALESDLNNNITLNGGTLSLATHLYMVGDKMPLGIGKIVLNDNQFYFGSDAIAPTHEIYWDMSSAINLRAKTSLSGTWTFSGTGSLNGNGNILDLRSGGRLVIDNDATLFLNDIVIEGLGDDTGLGSIIFMNDNSQVHMSNVAVVLASNYSTTIGGIYVEGPTTWYMDNYNWTFDQQASLTVDGTTLWKDSLNKINVGDITFDTPEINYLALLNSGTIKETANASMIRSSTTQLGDTINKNITDLDQLFQFFTTIDHGPTNIFYDSAPTMSYNIYLGPEHTMNLQETMIFNGDSYYIHFSRADEPLLFIDAGKTVTLQNVVLKDFSPDYISYGDENSNVVFGDNVTLELADDMTLARQWTCTGNVRIRGLDSKITLVTGGMLDVYNSSTLTLEDTIVSGLGVVAQGLRCRTNNGTIIVKDSELALTHDYTFSYGSMLFEHEAKITGTKAFIYATAATSTIASGAELLIDQNTTFSYNPPLANRDLLFLTDETSKLHFDGASLYSTPTGLRISSGTVMFDNFVTISAQGSVFSEAVSFGDNVLLEVLGGAYIETYGYIDL